MTLSRDTQSDYGRRKLCSTLKNRPKERPPGKSALLNSRPPLEIPNLNGPSFFSYNVPKNPPMMTSFPAYTLRPKTQADRDGGQQKAWGKEWFSHNYVWLQKADFDPRLNWPSPADYNINGGIGKKTPTQPQSRACSFGIRKEFSLVKKGASDEPGPASYLPQIAKESISSRAQAVGIQQGYRKGFYLWPMREKVPGPGSYNPRHCFKKCSPAFTFSKSRRRLDQSLPDTL